MSDKSLLNTSIKASLKYYRDSLNLENAIQTDVKILPKRKAQNTPYDCQTRSQINSKNSPFNSTQIQQNQSHPNKF